jgi:hypothetical protein
VRGFWGFRHIIEERLSNAPPESGPAQPDLSTPGTVVLAIDETEPATETLRTKLGALLDREVGVLEGGKKKLLDGLWHIDPPTGLAILLGHFHVRDSAAPDESYLQLAPEDRVTANDIVRSKFDHHGPVPPPGPLVMLLGCKTASADLSQLVEHVGALLNSGSRAVVGTTSSLTTQMVCEFAADVLNEMITR